MTSPNKLQVSELEHAEEFSERQHIFIYHFTVLKKVELTHQHSEKNK